MLYLQRDLTCKLVELTSQFPAVFLTGPRQSGKSTLLKHEFSHYGYVNLEDKDVREFAMNDPRGFLNEQGSRVIIDEAQRAPDLFSYLQRQIDENDHPGAYLLSGSQNFLMLKSISQSLAGRVGVLSLLPFTLSELAKANRMSKTVEQWMLSGCYPRVVAQNVFPENFYPSYLRTYVERDVRAEASIRDLTRFGTLLTACAARVGSLISFSDLGRDIGADARTVSVWLSILEESYLVFRLTPYYRNMGNRHVKTAKLYFYDTGLLCSLLGLESAQALTSSSLRGAIFENTIIAEKRKQLLNLGRTPRMYFWRDNGKRDREVDLIIETSPEQLELYEIKYSETANRRYLDVMRAFTEKSSAECVSAVIYRGPNLISHNGPNFYNWTSLAG